MKCHLYQHVFFHEKLIFLMVLPGSGLGLLPFAISPVVPTGSINCEPGIIFNNVFSYFSNLVSTACLYA